MNFPISAYILERISFVARSLIPLWCLALALVGCAPVTVVPESELVATASPVPVSPVNTVEDDVKRLLEAAEKALAEDRLTKPLHDNAFDRFQAVLLLKPNHPQAKSGLQLVLLRYLALARAAAARSEYTKARVLLDSARLVDKDSAQVAALARDLDAQQTRQNVRARGEKASPNEFPLSASRLDKRDAELVTLLERIARKARSTGESLLIIARGDAEGRWIYRQMKQAVPGFRLRGDIKLGRKAKVLLLPPIE